MEASKLGQESKANIPGRGDKVREAQMCEKSLQVGSRQWGRVPGVGKERHERKPVGEVGPDSERS